MEQCDINLPVTFPNGEKMDAKIMIRPYTSVLLKELSKLFELIVYTASSACYANAIIDYLDPEGKYISHRFYRENCIQTNLDGIFIKDLRIMKNRNLCDILFVDNAVHSFGF